MLLNVEDEFIDSVSEAYRLLNTAGSERYGWTILNIALSDNHFIINSSLNIIKVYSSSVKNITTVSNGKGQTVYIKYDCSLVIDEEDQGYLSDDEPLFFIKNEGIFLLKDCECVSNINDQNKTLILASAYIL